jgi:hypothetical protein
MIFQGCLDPNPEYCRSKLARYDLATHPSEKTIQVLKNYRRWNHLLVDIIRKIENIQQIENLKGPADRNFQQVETSSRWKTSRRWNI